LMDVLVVQKRHFQHCLSDIYPEHRTRHVSLLSDNLVHPSSTHLRVASDIVRPVKGGTRQGIWECPRSEREKLEEMSRISRKAALM
jgi:hypothetical protein